MSTLIDPKRHHTHTHQEIFEVRRWFSYMTLEGAFATVFIVFSGGVFLTGLALMWGANDIEIGLLAAIPFLAQAAQLLSAYFVSKVGQRKPVVFWGIAIGRQLWWIFIPLLFLSGEWRLYALIGLIIFSSIGVMISTPGWLSWMADLVPKRIRGRYFGVRSAAVSAATIIATICGGLILDKFRSLNHEQFGFAIIIGIAAICALIALLIMKKLPESSIGMFNLNMNYSLILEPLKDKNYRFLIIIFSLWNMAIGLGAAFFIPHMLNNLHMNFTQISMYLSLAALTAILLNKPWGSVIDKFGCKPVIAFCSFGIVLVPLIWWLPRPGFLWIFIFEAIYSGALWTGFNLAIFNIPIVNSPKDKRIVYLAMFSVVTGLGFFIASFIGGVLAEYLGHVSWLIGKHAGVNYQILFTASAVLRFTAAFLTLRLKEPQEKRIPIMIQFMGYSILKRLSAGRQLFPWALNKREREKGQTIYSD
jgi:MFS family permease